MLKHYRKWVKAKSQNVFGEIILFNGKVLGEKLVGEKFVTERF